MGGSDLGSRVAGVAVVALLLAGCAVASRAEGPASDPPGWTRADVAGEFSMALPPGLERVSAQGADSIVREYRSDTLRLVIDYGRYSDPLTQAEGEDLERRSVEVDGRDALLVTYRQPGGRSGHPYVAALHVPDVGRKGRSVRLTVVARGASERDQEQGIRIVRSVRFAVPRQ